MSDAQSGWKSRRGISPSAGSKPILSYFNSLTSGNRKGTPSAVVAIVLIAAGCTPSAPAPDPSARQPGSWKIVHTMTAFHATGVTGGMADMVAAGKASIGKPDNGGPVCLTAADTTKDTLRTRLDEAMRMGSEWRVVRSDFRDGRIDYAAALDDPVQGKATLSISGAISPVSTNLIVTTDAHEPAPGTGHIRTVARHEAARLGNC